MSKRVKVLVSMLVAVILVTVGGTTIAMAQEEETTPAPQVGVNVPLLARVAEILGISTGNLTSAFEQARQEIRPETCNQTMARQRITQRNINGIKERWMEQRQGIGKGFQGNQTESRQDTRLRISQSVRGRQMIAVPKGWQRPGPAEQAD